MDQRIEERLATISVAEPTVVDRLQLFGLRWDAGGDLSYTTLDEALAAGTLEISEVSESGSVPEFLVSNKSDTMVFLMAGEHLIGAKQNRVLNVSIMAPANSELRVPVSCVEAGRWGYRSRRFRSGGSSSHSKLRRMMSKHASDSYRRTHKPSSDQSAVWREVSDKLCMMGSSSPSEALMQAYEDHDVTLRDMVDKARVPEDCCGVAFVFGGRIVGVDLFDKPTTLSKLLPKLIRGYAIDAIEPAEPGSVLESDAVTSWLRSAAEAGSQPFDSPGVGTDVRIEGEKLVGASLLVEDRPVHTELFADEPQRQ